MKTITRTVIYLVIVATINVSCTTTEKFTINAPAGTKITLPMEGVVEPQSSNGGNVKVTIPSEGYCGYVLATPPDSNVPIPMGLNLIRNKHNGAKLALGCGYTLSSVGIVGMLGSLIVILGAEKNGDEDVSSAGAIICGASGAVAGIGAAMGAPAQARLRQTTYDYSFGYVKKQVLNLPQLSMILLHPDAEKNAKEVEGTAKRKKVASNKYNEMPSTTGTKVNKSRVPVVNKVVGKYIGTGELLLNKTQDEFYSSIEIDIVAADKNCVKVRILENGEDFFDEILVYSVKTDKNGGYVLRNDKMPDARITITKSGSLSFVHPKVNIDGVMYNLIIKANKQYTL